MSQAGQTELLAQGVTSTARMLLDMSLPVLSNATAPQSCKMQHTPINERECFTLSAMSPSTGRRMLAGNRLYTAYSAPCVPMPPLHTLYTAMALREANLLPLCNIKSLAGWKTVCKKPSELP